MMFCKHKPKKNMCKYISFHIIYIYGLKDIFLFLPQHNKRRVVVVVGATAVAVVVVMMVRNILMEFLSINFSELNFLFRNPHVSYYFLLVTY